jgi:hypothetical protein
MTTRRGKSPAGATSAPAGHGSAARAHTPVGGPQTAGGLAASVASGAVWRKLALRTAGGRPTDGSRRTQASAAAMDESRGEPLPAVWADRWSHALGEPVHEARVHTDAAAARAAQQLRARAVTSGRDVYFAHGEFNPGTSSGDRLLAHELTHVLQARHAPPAGTAPLRLSDPGEAHERAATRAEAQATLSPSVAAPDRAPGPVPARPSPSAAAPAVLYRQLDEALLLGELLGRAYRVLREDLHRDDVVELQGHADFEPNDDLARLIEDADGDAVPIQVRFGSLARGVIAIYLDEQDRYQSLGGALMPLYLDGLGDEDSGLAPMLVAIVDGGRVEGVFGGVSDLVARTDIGAVAREIADFGARQLLEWRGIDHATLDGHGTLGGGRLDLPARPFHFDLDGMFSGAGRFGVDDGNVVFDARADLQVPGLDNASLELQRDAQGALSGTAQMGVRLGALNGHLLATFGRGVLDIRGTARYEANGFSGTVTLLATNAASAWAAVNGELAPWMPAGTDRAGAGALSAAPAPAAGGADALAIAGWGVVEFSYKNWLRGSAQVVVDPNGDITSLGRVHVPQDIVIFEPRRTRQRITGIDRSVEVANVWDVVSVDLRARGGIDATAEIGPAHLRQLRAAGAFSTRPGSVNTLRIGGALELRAAAWLDVALRLEAAVTARIPVLGHLSNRFTYEVASTGFEMNARGEVGAAAEADASVERIARRGAGDADYVLDGRLDLDGHAAVEFGGRVDVRIPGVGYTKHLLDFDRRHWLLGNVHGSVGFHRYVIGGAQTPALSVQADGISVTSLLRNLIHHSGVPEQASPEDDHAEWRNTRPPSQIADEAADPTPAVMPADPRLGLATLPPVAAAAPDGAPAEPAAAGAAGAASGNAGVGPSGDDSSAGVDGPRDAGVPVAAGVPEIPDPVTLPDEPADPHRDEVEVPFDMEGSAHHLTLVPGVEAPELLMASEPGRLSTKLRATRADVARRASDPIRGAGLSAQLPVLAELIAEAELVEAEALRLGFGDRFHGAVPGLRPLADRIHSAAHQFDWHDFTPYLPTERVAANDAGDPRPAAAPSTAREVLGLPFEAFMAHVSTNVPAVDALPLLREQRRYFDLEVQDLNDALRNNPGMGVDDRRVLRDRREILVARVMRLDHTIRRLQDAISPDGRPQLPCFAPETLVHTPAGVRAIGSLQPGERVYCGDPLAPMAQVGRVVAVHRNRTLRFHTITVQGHSVRATGRHPFWVEDVEDWLPAAELEAGMRVRLLGGSSATIENTAVASTPDAPTVDLSVEPHPTYFVGPGILVHNTPRIYSWRQPDGSNLPQGNWKVYLGRNPGASEWADCVYVGQTVQNMGKREADHQAEARAWLEQNPHVPDTDADKRYYRFKSGIRLEAIAIGLRTEGQADWLEQKNIEHERTLRPLVNVMNRREELRTTGPAVERAIRDDPTVAASGYCT